MVAAARDLIVRDSAVDGRYLCDRIDAAATGGSILAASV
jgi:hypothetical protein